MSKAIQQIRAFCYGCACLTLLGFLFVFGPLVAIFLWNVISDSAAR